MMTRPRRETAPPLWPIHEKITLSFGSAPVLGSTFSMPKIFVLASIKAWSA